MRTFMNRIPKHCGPALWTIVIAIKLFANPVFAGDISIRAIYPYDSNDPLALKIIEDSNGYMQIDLCDKRAMNRCYRTLGNGKFHKESLISFAKKFGESFESNNVNVLGPFLYGSVAPSVLFTSIRTLGAVMTGGRSGMIRSILTEGSGLLVLTGMITVPISVSRKVSNNNVEGADILNFMIGNRTEKAISLPFDMKELADDLESDVALIVGSST